MATVCGNGLAICLSTMEGRVLKAWMDMHKDDMPDLLLSLYGGLEKRHL